MVSAAVSVRGVARLAILIAVAVAGVVACAGPGAIPRESQTSCGDFARPPADEIDIAQAAEGYRIAKEHCASCHAIDATSASPRSEAPPLRTILAVVPESMLTDHLIEGVRIGHDEMPRFDFTVRAADALVAYLKSIQTAPSPQLDSKSGKGR